MADTLECRTSGARAEAELPHDYGNHVGITQNLPLAQELALRAALAIDNARLYAAERTARSEAEAAVRVREELLAIAAHELKTPVTSMGAPSGSRRRRTAGRG